MDIKRNICILKKIKVCFNCNEYFSKHWKIIFLNSVCISVYIIVNGSILHKNYFSYQFIEFGQKNSLARYEFQRLVHDKYTGRRGDCPCKKFLCGSWLWRNFLSVYFSIFLAVVGIPALICTIERR